MPFIKPVKNLGDPDVWWQECKTRTKLMDGFYTVGDVTFVPPLWHAHPKWDEKSQLFEKEEEAKAWLATMWRFKQ